MYKVTGPGFLRVSALLMLSVAAIMGMVNLFSAGSQQKAVLLILLFTGWNLLPFILLIFAERKSRLWMQPQKTALYLAMLAVALFSMLGYSGWLIPDDSKPAFVFLVVPFLSLVMIFFFFLTKWMISSRKSS